MKDILGQYFNDYSEISSNEENQSNFSEIYNAHNNKYDRDCILKIISKDTLKKVDYDLMIQQLKREEEITQLCASENIVKFYRKIETDNAIIFELENCDGSLKKFMDNNGNIEGEEGNEENLEQKLFFKKVAVEMAKGLKKIHEKKVMHRDIKPDNIFMKNYNDYYNDLDKLEIKIGDFGCSIFIKDNNSEGIGTVFYSAPEIIQGLEYDEKCDIWSFGITLYELYFGCLPYGVDPSLNEILTIIDNPKEFILRKSNIPNLDIFFKKVLAIDPNERMGYDELFDYIFSENFMNKDVICINNNEKYLKIYDIIIKEKQVKYDIGYEQEGLNDEKIEAKNTKTLLKIANGGQFPDIMNFPNRNITGEERYNNIIYYDENSKDYSKSINKDSDIFERNTTGAFILCTNMESLKLIREEILVQIKRDKRITFNVITTGSACDKIISFIKENNEFEECIKKVCVFCMNLKNWLHLKDKYPIVHGVHKSRKEILKFIDLFSKKDVKPYPLVKLVTYENYYSKYKDAHKKISLFYGDLNIKTYEKNLKEMKELINEEEKSKELINKNKNNFLNGLLKFNITEDLETLDKLIIKEYTKNSYFGDLNKWLMNSKLNSYDTIAYYTARLMYSLNSYGKNKKKYLTERKELYRGIKIPYSCLLPYERAKGKVILMSAFTSTSEKENVARTFSHRNTSKIQYKNRKLFSIIFRITNIYKNNWVSNCVNVQEEAEKSFQKEKEILYQPFSFYYVKDVQIDIPNYSADIILETIGKEEILEEKIQIGKEIQYNEKKRIMEVKN